MLGGLRYMSGCSLEVVSFISKDLQRLSFDEAREFYADLAEGAIKFTDQELRLLGCNDRFFLFTAMLNRPDAIHPWLYERCREVEADPDEHLDLWSREHYKSSLITFAGIIQEIIRDPEITIGVFSVTKDIAKKFVAQVKDEIDGNADLRALYSDVFWDRASKDAPVWSSLELTVRRSTNPKESTLEAHGLIDGMPTGRHFRLRVYDDVVTERHVGNPEMVKKVTERWELSDNLGGGEQRRWHIGTRYSFGDTYGQILDRGILKPRVYPATDDGTINGDPVFFSREKWEKKKKTQRSSIAAQLLQNPLAGAEASFRPEWLTPFPIRPRTLNVYIMADPSKGRSATSDRTAIAVIGVDAQGNKYLLDGYRHRMKLSERWDALSGLRKKWAHAFGVGLCEVGYERYGQQTDDEYFTERMERSKDPEDAFSITELNWVREGGQSKKDRVERLEPDFRLGNFYLPPRVYHAGLGECLWHWSDDEKKIVYTPVKKATRVEADAVHAGERYRVTQPIKRRDEDGNIYDLTLAFIEEYSFFPFSPKDDLIDAVSRIYDMSPERASTVNEVEQALAIPTW